MYYNESNTDPENVNTDPEDGNTEYGSGKCEYGSGKCETLRIPRSWILNTASLSN